MKYLILALVLSPAAFGSWLMFDCCGGAKPPSNVNLPPGIPGFPPGGITLNVSGTGLKPSGETEEVKTTGLATNSSGDDITWNPGGATKPGDPVSGTGGATGTATKDPDYDKNKKWHIKIVKDLGGGKTLTVEGDITEGSSPPPPNATGTGSWTVTGPVGGSPNGNLGQGSWDFK